MWQWRRSYVCQNVTMKKRLCSSHCNVKIFSTHFDVAMFVTSWHPFFHHIATKGICSSHCNICICLSHYEITMFAMLGLCSSPYDDRDMFITLQRQGYHHHIMMSTYVGRISTLLFSSHYYEVILLNCHDRAMFVALDRSHMFVTLWR